MLIKDALGIGNKALQGRERAQEAGRDSGGGGRAAEAAASSGDRVDISGRSKEMAKAHEALSATPEVRQNKVEDVKARLANGSYEVDADEVANKMILDFLNEMV